MIDRAVGKITKEMMKYKDSREYSALVNIEEYLAGICTNYSVAKKLLNEEKIYTMHTRP